MTNVEDHGEGKKTEIKWEEVKKPQPQGRLDPMDKRP